MQPETARHFLKAALQRLSAAEDIFKRLGLTLESQYIGGYAVECALKALIMDKTPESERLGTLDKITHGASSHQMEVLLSKLRELGVSPTRALAKRMRRFEWTTALRYETGRLDTGETRAVLRTAKMICDWVKGELS